jgi:hypothetical protein
MMSGNGSRAVGQLEGYGKMSYYLQYDRTAAATVAEASEVNPDGPRAVDWSGSPHSAAVGGAGGSARSSRTVSEARRTCRRGAD